MEFLIEPPVYCVTGHRPDKFDNDYDLVSPRIKAIDGLFQEIIDRFKPKVMISGLALGIDTVWALAAIRNKINLLCAIPCLDQEKRWPRKSQKIYNEIINSPFSRVHYVSKVSYTKFCMQQRNIWMVQQIWRPDDRLVSVYDGTPGGTQNCIEYAAGRNVSIININPVKLTVDYDYNYPKKGW